MINSDGKLERARAQVALGLRIAQARDMLGISSLDGLGLADRARRQEIVWSLFMLDRMLLGGNTKNRLVSQTKKLPQNINLMWFWDRVRLL